MSEVTERIAQYTSGDGEAVPPVVQMVLDVLEQMATTIASVGAAVALLDVCDDARAAETLALAARVTALEATHSVRA